MNWIEGDTYAPNDFQMWMIEIFEKIDWKSLPKDKWILKNIDLFPTRLGNVVKLYEFRYIACSQEPVDITLFISIWESGLRIDPLFPKGNPQFESENLQLFLKQGENMTKYLQEAFRYYIEREEKLKNGFLEKKYRLRMDDINLFSSLIR